MQLCKEIRPMTKLYHSNEANYIAVAQVYQDRCFFSQSFSCFTAFLTLGFHSHGNALIGACKKQQLPFTDKTCFTGNNFYRKENSGFIGKKRFHRKESFRFLGKENLGFIYRQARAGRTVEVTLTQTAEEIP